MTKTNITKKHRDEFTALRDAKYTNFALFSAFFDGEPTSVIVAVNQDENENYIISPLFVALTDKMKDKIKDHEGRIPIDGLPKPTDSVNPAN